MLFIILVILDPPVKFFVKVGDFDKFFPDPAPSAQDRYDYRCGHTYEDHPVYETVLCIADNVYYSFHIFIFKIVNKSRYLIIYKVFMLIPDGKKRGACGPPKSVVVSLLVFFLVSHEHVHGDASEDQSSCYLHSKDRSVFNAVCYKKKAFCQLQFPTLVLVLHLYVYLLVVCCFHI